MTDPGGSCYRSQRNVRAEGYAPSLLRSEGRDGFQHELSQRDRPGGDDCDPDIAAHVALKCKIADAGKYPPAYLAVQDSGPAASQTSRPILECD